MREPAYMKVRKRTQRENLLKFLTENLFPDYMDYEQLDDLKRFVQNETAECGEYGAFCDFYELGRWFESRMEDCEFDLEDFYNEYAKEIEWRAQP